VLGHVTDDLPLMSIRSHQSSFATERIDFKSAVFAYRCLHGSAPIYLANYIQSFAQNCTFFQQ
jgi:hypothetical protein